MADNLQQRGGQDRTRIDVSQEHERRDWAKKFGVTPEQLEQAVRSVGEVIVHTPRIQWHGAAGYSGRVRR